MFQTKVVGLQEVRTIESAIRLSLRWTRQSLFKVDLNFLNEIIWPF